MIESGEVVIRMGDLRLFARIEDGRLNDLWTVNDLGYESRATGELQFAVERADGAAMFLKGVLGVRPRELSAHERMWAMRVLQESVAASPC